MTDLYLTCFFAGAFVGTLGTLTVLVGAATRFKKKQLSEDAQKQQTEQKTE